MTFSNELDLDTVEMSHLEKYLGQIVFGSYRANTQTPSHSRRPTTLLGPRSVGSKLLQRTLIASVSTIMRARRISQTNDGNSWPEYQ